jgi:hypothetical protein
MRKIGGFEINEQLDLSLKTQVAGLMDVEDDPNQKPFDCFSFIHTGVVCDV